MSLWKAEGLLIYSPFFPHGGYGGAGFTFLHPKLLRSTSPAWEHKPRDYSLYGDAPLSLEQTNTGARDKEKLPTWAVRHILEGGEPSLSNIVKAGLLHVQLFLRVPHLSGISAGNLISYTTTIRKSLLECKKSQTFPWDTYSSTHAHWVWHS